MRVEEWKGRKQMGSVGYGDVGTVGEGRVE